MCYFNNTLFTGPHLQASANSNCTVKILAPLPSESAVCLLLSDALPHLYLSMVSVIMDCSNNCSCTHIHRQILLLLAPSIHQHTFCALPIVSSLLVAYQMLYPDPQIHNKVSYFSLYMSPASWRIFHRWFMKPNCVSSVSNVCLLCSKTVSTLSQSAASVWLWVTHASSVNCWCHAWSDLHSCAIHPSLQCCCTDPLATELLHRLWLVSFRLLYCLSHCNNLKYLVWLGSVLLTDVIDVSLPAQLKGKTILLILIKS